MFADFLDTSMRCDCSPLHEKALSQLLYLECGPLGGGGGGRAATVAGANIRGQKKLLNFLLLEVGVSS